MSENNLVELAWRAFQAKRYDTLAFCSRQLLEKNPRNLDAASMWLSSLLGNNIWRQNIQFFEHFRTESLASTQMAVVYFDYFAVSEQFEELFLHIWECNQRADLVEAYLYMEKALPFVASRKTSRLLEAEASLSCTIEMSLIDRVIVSFSEIQNAIPCHFQSKSEFASYTFFDVSEFLRLMARDSHPTGIQRMIAEILSCIPADYANFFGLFFRPDVEFPFCMPMQNLIQLLNCHEGAALSERLVYGNLAELPEYAHGVKLRKEDVLVLLDAFWAPAPHRLMAIIDDSGCKTVLFVHDIIPVVMSDEPAHGELFDAAFDGLAKRVAGFLCNSQATANDLEIFLKSKNIDKSIKVVQLATAKPTKFELFSQGERINYQELFTLRSLCDRRFALSVSSISPRKRMIELAEAFVEIVDELSETDCLVIVGGAGGAHGDLVARLEALCKMYPTRLFWIKAASDETLRYLYENCAFTAYVSIYEGWGLPVGESLAYRKVPLVHRVSSIPEVAGDLAVYCELGTDALKNGLLHMFSDQVHLTERQDRIASSKLRSWTEVAKELMTGIDEILNRGAIKISSFAMTAAPYLAHSTPGSIEEGTGLVSQICRYETLYSPAFRYWIDLLKLEVRPHRKLWELAYIMQALDEAGMIAPGRRGIAFAVGQERTPALLASLGCDVLATDLAADDTRNVAWAETGQWAGGLDGLKFPAICDDDTMTRHVTYRAVDMNSIPEDLCDFDFSWSTCSFEHCGSIELGIRFLENQMNCLKPGGIAVHTTEFNLTSNDDTWTSGSTSIYRLRDIVECIERLTRNGHVVAPLDLSVGTHPLDLYVDRPAKSYPHYTEDKHLRLQLGNFASTSIGLIIRKGLDPM